MAANVLVEDAFAAATEVAVGQIAASGALSLLTLATHAIEVEDFSMTVDAQDIERADYPDTAAGELATIPGGRSWNWSATVPARYNGVGSAAPEVDPLLTACGLSGSASSADWQYVQQTAPLSQHSSAVIACTEGTAGKWGYGAAANMVWSGKSGDISRFAFSGKALHMPAQEASIPGAYAVNGTAPPVCDRMFLQLAAGSLGEAALENTLNVLDFSFDLGAKVEGRGKGNLLRYPCYAVYTHDTAGSYATATVSDGTFVDETAAANNDTANDVECFPAATPAIGDAIYWIAPFPFSGVTANVGTVGSTVHTIVWEYWDRQNTAWTALPFSVQNMTDFDDATTGIKHNLFEPPTNWGKATIGGTGATAVTGYAIRARISAYTSNTTDALLTQAWTLFKTVAARFAVVNVKPRLSITVEQEAASTFDPDREFFARTTRTILHQVGTANHNSIQLNMTAAKLMAEPELKRDGGLIQWGLVYGAATSWNLKFI